MFTKLQPRITAICGCGLENYTLEDWLCHIKLFLGFYHSVHGHEYRWTWKQLKKSVSALLFTSITISWRKS